MDGYELFKQNVFKKTGIDLSSYKERQMKRRIESLMQRNGFKDFEKYFNAFKQETKMFDEFINYLTINVSEFYRNPQQWEVLEKEIFPMLLQKKSNIKIWSAACSTGEEPYSLVMHLTKFLPLNQINILATDIDSGAINKAKVGLYSAKSLTNLPKAHIDNYFTQIGDSYKISDKIKSRVSFERHNLLNDSYPSNCDLIICRNVMIYFTEEAKHDMYHKFHNALVKDGILFVGSTEQIILPNKYNLTPMKTFFYTKM